MVFPYKSQIPEKTENVLEKAGSIPEMPVYSYFKTPKRILLFLVVFFLPFPIGTYLYIETSYPRRHGDRALLSLNATGGNCLSFWYHMWGVGLGELNVYYKESQMTAPQLAWHMQGNQGNLWKFAQVSFNGYNAEVENARGDVRTKVTGVVIVVHFRG